MRHQTVDLREKWVHSMVV